jgi:hypothetical protein
MKTIGIVLLLPTTIAVGIFDSYVLTKLWLWFVMPVIHVGPITKVEAYGLMLTLSLMRFTPDAARKVVEGGFLVRAYSNLAGVFVFGVISISTGFVLLRLF